MKTITLTGADERTSIVQLEQLVATYPFVEIGILYKASGAGNRYPSWSWIKEATSALAGRVALHLCGPQARAQLEAGTISVLRNVSRIQVNGHLTSKELNRYIVSTRSKPVITQHNSGNLSLAHLDVWGHQVLVDASGGLGILPAIWKRPIDAGRKRVGFAGGLGPENLSTELPKIALAAGEYCDAGWVDMEAKLRDKDDWFDLSRAKKCAEIFAAWRDSRNPKEAV